MKLKTFRVPRVLVIALGMALSGAAYWHLQAAGGPAAPDAGVRPLRVASNVLVAPAQSALPAGSGGANYRAVLDKYCVRCHNQRLRTAELALDELDITKVGPHAETWEKVVKKLRARTMPPAPNPRPDEAIYDRMAAWLEGALDVAAAASPNPGAPTLHRLNRIEYANAIRDVLALDIDGTSLLPPDASANGFDNNGDVLSISPLLMEQYMMAAREISRLALGDPTYTPYVETYRFSRDKWQVDRMSEDLPFGSRGGMAIHRYFSLDGEYVLRIRLARALNDRGIRGISRPERIQVRVDHELVKEFTVGKNFDEKGQYDVYRLQGDAALERRHLEESADDALVTTFPVKAGNHTVGVFFVDASGALYEGLGPERFPVQSQANTNDDGNQMQMESIQIGPVTPAGTGETASRRQILTCRPASAALEESCAKTILSALARRAYRRTPTEAEVATLLTFYRRARETGGDFEAGVGAGLRRALVSPQFLFRVEREPAKATPGAPYRLGDVELASRLSFFLWSSVPDAELLDAAERGRLRDPKALQQQVRRMLRDARAAELMRNFGGQWLLLRNVRYATPDPDNFPEFDDNLREALQRETELFLENLLREDRSVTDLLGANYTFLNERLARHYGINNVYGNQYRRVTLNDDRRGGLLGMGSIQLVTSQATRTSPVLRGKWVLENILGTPPPAPPANVPPFPDNGDMTKLSVRERMELHRKNPSCASCHQMMDPLGFALENFDAVGKWRDLESGKPIDASGTTPDGRAFNGPAELRKLVMSHQEQFVATLTSKLMTYALGRGVEYFDAPAIRKIVRDAAPNQYRWSSIVLGIVESLPFQQRVSEATPQQSVEQRLN
jgi:mono/diheme cytochrome c family protein